MQILGIRLQLLVDIALFPAIIAIGVEKRLIFDGTEIEFCGEPDGRLSATDAGTPDLFL